METRVLMLGFNDYGDRSDLTNLASATSSFEVLKRLLTHEQADVRAIDPMKIHCYIDLHAYRAREKIKKIAAVCSYRSEALLIYLTGHGVIANTERNGDIFVVPARGAKKIEVRRGESDHCLRVEDEILVPLRAPNAPSTTIIVDCCNANSLVKGAGVHGARAAGGITESLHDFSENSDGRIAIISTSGTAESAWETNWAKISPCRSGLKETYQLLGIDDTSILTSFTGALVDVWGSSNTRIPTELTSVQRDALSQEYFHLDVAIRLNEVLKQTKSGLVSAANGAYGAKQLLSSIGDKKLQQHISISDPRKIAWEQPLFRLPSPSRDEKLNHLSDYVSEMSAVTEKTRKDLLDLIFRGRNLVVSKADKFPYTAIDLEDRLYVASIDSTEPEFVEEFLLNGVSERIGQELDVRSRKWKVGLDSYDRIIADLRGKLFRHRFLSWTFGLCSIALFAVLLYTLKII